MIQPIMVTSQQPDGQIVQQTQYQIIRQSDDGDMQNQVLQVVCIMLCINATLKFALYIELAVCSMLTLSVIALFSCIQSYVMMRY